MPTSLSKATPTYMDISTVIDSFWLDTNITSQRHRGTLLTHPLIFSRVSRRTRRKQQRSCCRRNRSIPRPRSSTSCSPHSPSPVWLRRGSLTGCTQRASPCSRTRPSAMNSPGRYRLTFHGLMPTHMNVQVPAVLPSALSMSWELWSTLPAAFHFDQLIDLAPVMYFPNRLSSPQWNGWIATCMQEQK